MPQVEHDAAQDDRPEGNGEAKGPNADRRDERGGDMAHDVQRAVNLQGYTGWLISLEQPKHRKTKRNQDEGSDGPEDRVRAQYFHTWIVRPSTE